MRDYEKETISRVEFIKNLLSQTGAAGIVYGNSGGKDCTLVGILCKKACNNTLGIIMPCGSSRNYNSDKNDAEEVSKKFDIEYKIVDLTSVKENLVESIKVQIEPSELAIANIAPRLRMTTLYTVAATENRLVCGTGNRSESFMGYFTKWGDGAYDFNPISDLTVTEIYEFLEYLGAPENIIEKDPSAGLFEGQTDENEMGVTYKAIDNYIFTGEASEEEKRIIEKRNKASEHKRSTPILYIDSQK